MPNLTDLFSQFNELHLLLLAAVCSFLLQWRLFFVCQHTALKLQLSANVQVNVVTWVVNVSSCLAYTIFILITDGEQKSGRLLFLIGALLGAAGVVVSLTVMFLMLDRLFIILWPARYKIYNTEFIYLTVFSCVLAFGAYFLIVLYTEGPFEDRTDCRIYLCLMKRNGYLYVSVLRISVGCLNVCVSVVFYITLWKYLHAARRTQKPRFKNANLIVCVAITNELIFSFFPHLIIVIMSFLHTPVQSAFAAVMIAVNMLVEACVYTHIIRVPSNTKIEPRGTGQETQPSR